MMIVTMLFLLPLAAFASGLSLPIPQLPSALDMFIAQAALGLGQSLEDLSKALGIPGSYPEHYNVQQGEEFDFIVVGAGMMGCVLANRLSEVTGWKILLLEAGDDPGILAEIPALGTRMFNSEVDWQYKTEADGKNCLGYKDKKCSYISGKMLGGTYNLGFNIYIGAKENDYKQWAAQGITGWTYEEALRYTKKSENMMIKSVLEYSPGRHGTEGPVTINNWVEYGTFEKYFSVAADRLGYPLNPDSNGKDPSGYSIIQGSLEKGRRMHPAKAYLKPIKDRKNLKVSKNSLVTKVLIDENTKVAKGVEFINKEGRTVQAFSKKEVVISSGTIGSPKILMLSGIGPKDHLEEHGITVLSDLPVGHNLQDFHAYFGAVVTTNYSDPQVSQTKSLVDLLLNKESILTNSLPLSHALAFSTENDKDYPNGFTFIPRISKNDTATVNILLDDTFGFDDLVKDQYYKLNSESSILAPLLANLKSRSQGKVELRSTDPKDYPKIFAGFFTDERDAEDLLSFYDFLEKLVNTPELQALDAKIHELRAPECDEKFEYGTREYRRCALPYFSVQYLHLTGTCKMGADNDTTAVVDSNLRVKGILNLIVCDYSVFPFVDRGTGYWIGEKLADMLKAAWTN